MERTIYLCPDCCAVTEDGRLVEYIPRDAEGQTGAILMARADRMMPGLESVFADIGRRKSALLPVPEKSRTFRGPALRSGDIFAAQIRREENGGKGALLSRDLSLPGRYMILMPLNRFTGVSSRITDAGERTRLTETGRALSQDQYGLVMRSAARDEGEVLAAGPGWVLQKKSLMLSLKQNKIELEWHFMINYNKEQIINWKQS